MTDWEPATEVEAAMRDALRAGDQELYFRILARSELLLPVSSDALAGRAQVGWGTWTTNGRTHVLAFTSGEALRICLADNAGSARRMPYHDLAATWPNLEWWLAVNPGLPIEGYLPAWFVAQLARGDVKLPGRTMGARARLDRAESAARARARASVPGQVVQGEIIEPPFVDRAAAVTGPVLEPDSIEPPQRNRPTRPPGFDSPLASMRRRGGVPAPTDATPSSPAAPPPFRPVPTPHVTDVTPEPYRSPMPPPQVADVTPEPYRSPMPPPQVTDVTPEPYRSPMPAPQVADVTPEPYRSPMPAPQVADVTPEPYRPPTPPPQVTDVTPEPYRTPMPPPQVGDPAPHRQRPVQRPAANGESAWPPPVVHGDPTPRPLRQPTDPPRDATERPTPSMRPRSPFRDDPARSSPPGRFAPPRPPRPQARPTSGGGFFGGSDQPEQGQSPSRSGTPGRDDQRQPNWSPANGAATSVPHETRPSAGTPNGSATSPSPWPAAGRDAPGWADSTPPARPAPAWPAAPAPSPTASPSDASAQPWAARQPGPDLSGANGPRTDRPVGSGPRSSSDLGPVRRTPGQSWPETPVGGAPRPQEPPAAQPWPGQQPGSVPGGPTGLGDASWPGRASGSAPAQRWADQGSDAPASSGAASFQPVSGTPASTTPQSWDRMASTPAAPVGDPQNAAADRWTDLHAPATPVEPAPVVGAKPTPRATDLWSDQKRSDPTATSEPAARATDLWSAQQPAGGPATAAEKPRATDLWSAPRPLGEPAPAAAGQPPATDSWSGDPGGSQAGSAKPRATDLWSGDPVAGGPQAGSGKPLSTDLWSGGQPTDGLEHPGSDQPRATDLWSGERPAAGSVDGVQRSGSDKPEATGLWSAERPVAGAAEDAPQVDSDQSRAAELLSGGQPNGSVDAARADAGGPRAADLWSDSKPTETGEPAPRGQQPAESKAPTASDLPGATDLWKARATAAEPAARATDLWSGQTSTVAETARPQSAGDQSRTEDGVAGEAASSPGSLWSGQKPDEAVPAKPAAADQWSGQNTEWSGQNTEPARSAESANAEEPAESGSLGTDLWSAAESQPGAAESTPRAVDLWANQTTEQARTDQPAKTDQPVKTDEPAKTDGSANTDEPDTTDEPAAAPAVSLWAEQKPASDPADLWSGDSPAGTPSLSWSDAASAGTAENPVTTPATSWSGRASTGTDRQWTDSTTPASDDAAAHSWAGRTPTTGTTASSWMERPVAQQEPSVFAANAGPVPADFVPANDVEESLLTAAGSGSTDTFLSTLLLARVLLPVSTESAKNAQPGSDGFVWRTETIDDEPFVVVFTSAERMAEYLDKGTETVTVKFVRLINSWPKENWSFAVNPGTPVGAKLPGAQIVALASWAAEVGLSSGDDEPVVAAAPKEEAPAPDPAPAAVDAALPTMMQKTIAPSQVDYYLERGYDRVSGFVHRVTEVSHLRTPAQLFTALGLGYASSPFAADAGEVYVLRWPAYRPSLYRIPYGGQNENAMRAMEGWVIERSPFRGNGFAPGEGSDVIAEFKVDSARLPHGAQLWLIRADGSEKVVATLDADAPGWTRAGDQ